MSLESRINKIENILKTVYQQPTVINVRFIDSIQSREKDTDSIKTNNTKMESETLVKDDCLFEVILT